MGKQSWIMLFNLAGFWGTGVPLGYTFTFTLKHGIVGLWYAISSSELSAQIWRWLAAGDLCMQAPWPIPSHWHTGRASSDLLQSRLCSRWTAKDAQPAHPSSSLNSCSDVLASSQSKIRRALLVFDQDLANASEHGSKLLLGVQAIQPCWRLSSEHVG